MNKYLYLLDEDEAEFINNMSKLTGVDYELKGNAITIESLISIIKDLHIEIINRDEEIEKLKGN